MTTLQLVLTLVAAVLLLSLEIYARVHANRLRAEATKEILEARRRDRHDDL